MSVVNKTERGWPGHYCWKSGGEEIKMSGARRQIRYCEYWCGPLSQEQIVMVCGHVLRSTYLGVGRMPGQAEYYPMVLIGSNPQIVDKAGHYSVAALEGRRSYEYETSCTTCEKAGGECNNECFWESVSD